MQVAGARGIVVGVSWWYRVSWWLGVGGWRCSGALLAALVLASVMEEHGALPDDGKARVVLPERVVHRLLEAKNSLLVGPWQAGIKLLEQRTLHEELELFLPRERPAGEPPPAVVG